jgi:hypothetical protein
MKMVDDVAVLKKKLMQGKNRDKRLNLFIQVLLIFGFFDLSNPEHCEAVIEVVEKSAVYKHYVKTAKTFILPNIDYMITLLVHDPRMERFRKDRWSTLPGFKLKPYKLSESDRLVADFLAKIMQLPSFTPAVLFREYTKHSSP